MSSKVEQWTDVVAEQVRGELAKSQLPLIPKRIQIREDIDPLGEDAWRLVLILPAPAGDTWDRVDVFKARRAAVDSFDRIVADTDRELPGSTIAIVTTDEASEDDTAPAEVPEEGEDPGRTP